MNIAVIHILKNLGDATSRSSKQDLFVGLRAEINAFGEKHPDVEVFQHFELDAWIESQLSNITMEQYYESLKEKITV